MEYASKVWVPFSDIPALQTPQVQFVHGRASKVDCQAKEAVIDDGEEPRIIKYDYLIAVTGLRRAYPTVPQSLRRKHLLQEVGSHLGGMEDAGHGVVVIGGGKSIIYLYRCGCVLTSVLVPGAVGIEMAAELKCTRPEITVTLVHSRPKLLSAEPLPDELRDCALDLVRDAGVQTIMDARVTEIEEKSDDDGTYRLSLSNGGKIDASMVINAVSKFVPTGGEYLPKELLDEQGYVRIKPW